MGDKWNTNKKSRWNAMILIIAASVNDLNTPN